MEIKATRVVPIVLMAVAVFLAACQQPQETEVGPQALLDRFDFVGGFPTEESVQLAFDQLDFQRAAQVYLEFMPAMSTQSIFESMIRDNGLTSPGDVGVYVQPGEGKSEVLGLTYNTESIYASAEIDLHADGPTVVEVPPEVLGVVDDGWQRYITDLGNAGPDRGQGGRYLILPPDYEGDIPDGYFTFTSPTYRNWVMVRGFVENTGTGDDALSYYRERFRMYPLATGPRDDVQYVSMTRAGGNTTHPRDFSYFQLLDQMVQYEPSSAFTPYELGLLMAIGIKKGEPFAPDARMRKILSQGVQLGDAIAKANAYANRLPGVRIYPDRKYEALFLGGNHEFKDGEATYLDARLLFHYEAIVVTPAMSRKMVGIGSQYLACYRDTDDNFLMGQNNYRLTLPAGIPAANFWSVTAYHPDTRSLLQNGQDKPSVSSYDEPVINEDGSVDIYFGPEAPEGYENNWIKTIPGEGWQILMRLYGPLEPYFDQTWKPNDIVKVN